MIERTEMQLQATWVLDGGIMPAPANQILIQDGIPVEGGFPSDVYVTFGHLNPPIFASQEAMQELVGNTVLPVLPVARLLLSRDRLKSFHAAIGLHLAAMEEQEQAMKAREHSEPREQ